MKIRDATEKILQKKYDDIAEELLTAKKILKDPNLSLIATRKFNGHIEKSDPGKFMAKNCVLTDLQEEPEKETEEFEVEMLQENEHKILPGVQLNNNCDIPAGSLSVKN